MNLLGKIVNPETILGDVILLYVYDDGSVEKKSIRQPTVIRKISGNIGFIRCRFPTKYTITIFNI